MEIKQIKYLSEKTLSYLIEKCKATFALINHKHTASEVGADASGSAASALGLANQYTDEKVATITSGDTVVKESEHSSTADEATHATSADTATKADTATSAESAIKAEQDGNGNVIADTYETKDDASSKLNEAKAYADNATTTVKNELLNGAGEAYDTLKELGELIDENVDAIEALETIATSKADADHVHSWNELEEKPFYENTTEVNEYLIKDCTASSPGICNAKILSRFIEEEIVNVSINDEVLTDQWMQSANYTSLTGYHYGFFCGNPTLLPLYHSDVKLGGDLVDTGDDFLIYLQDSDNQVGSDAVLVILRNYPDESVVSVYRTKTETELKTLNEKYIPDTIARTAYVDENFALKSDLENIDLSAYETKEDAVAKLNESKAYTDEQIENHIHSWNELEDKPFGNIEYSLTETIIEPTEVVEDNDSIDFKINAGEEYIVELNGKYYPVVAIDNSSGTATTVTLINHDLFHLEYVVLNSTGIGIHNLIRINSSEPVIFALYKGVKGKESQLDEIYIPDTIARTSYVDENFALKSDLQNIDLSSLETKEDAQVKYDEAIEYTNKQIKSHVHSWNDLEDKPFITEQNIDDAFNDIFGGE